MGCMPNGRPTRGTKQGPGAKEDRLTRIPHRRGHPGQGQWKDHTAGGPPGAQKRRQGMKIYHGRQGRGDEGSVPGAPSGAESPSQRRNQRESQCSGSGRTSPGEGRSLETLRSYQLGEALGQSQTPRGEHELEGQDQNCRQRCSHEPRSLPSTDVVPAWQCAGRTRTQNSRSSEEKLKGRHATGGRASCAARRPSDRSCSTKQADDACTGKEPVGWRTTVSQLSCHTAH